MRKLLTLLALPAIATGCDGSKIRRAFSNPVISSAKETQEDCKRVIREGTIAPFSGTSGIGFSFSHKSGCAKEKCECSHHYDKGRNFVYCYFESRTSKGRVPDFSRLVLSKPSSEARPGKYDPQGTYSKLEFVKRKKSFLTAEEYDSKAKGGAACEVIDNRERKSEVERIITNDPAHLALCAKFQDVVSDAVGDIVQTGIGKIDQEAKNEPDAKRAEYLNSLARRLTREPYYGKKPNAL